MIPNNFKILIDKLKEKTLKKETIWSKTSRNNEFKLDLGKGAIITDNWTDDELVWHIEIVIMNDRGDAIDRIAFSIDEKEDYNYLLELHGLAKKSYYKVDETFKNIFKELDGDKIIGKEDNSDNLPF